MFLLRTLHIYKVMSRKTYYFNVLGKISQMCIRLYILFDVWKFIHESYDANIKTLKFVIMQNLIMVNCVKKMIIMFGTCSPSFFSFFYFS
jgi:hypothetical protein